MVANSHGCHPEGTSNGFDLASADELQAGENAPLGRADQRRLVHTHILVPGRTFHNREFIKVDIDKLSDRLYGEEGSRPMAYIIAEPCVGTKDTACVDVCPVDCIHPAKNRDYHGGPESQGTKNFDEVTQLYINSQECIDCGACVPVCPVTAIFPLEDLPDKWANYTQINADYFNLAAE